MIRRRQGWRITCEEDSEALIGDHELIQFLLRLDLPHLLISHRVFSKGHLFNGEVAACSTVKP